MPDGRTGCSGAATGARARGEVAGEPRGALDAAAVAHRLRTDLAVVRDHQHVVRIDRTQRPERLDHALGDDVIRAHAAPEHDAEAGGDPAGGCWACVAVEDQLDLGRWLE